MDELDDPLGDLKRALVDCIEREGSWDSEAARLAIPPHTLREWQRTDEAFAGAVTHARSARQRRTRAAVEQRLLSIVLHGEQQVLTYQGKVQYRPQRGSDGQPLVEQATDAKGTPLTRLDNQGNPHPIMRERLELDSFGMPIPVTVPRYAERTTLELARALGLLERVETNEDAGQEVVVLLDSEGEQLSFAELLKRSITGAQDNEPTTVQEGKGQGQG